MTDTLRFKQQLHEKLDSVVLCERSARRRSTCGAPSVALTPPSPKSRSRSGSILTSISDDGSPEQHHRETDKAEKASVQRRDSCKGGLRDFRCKMIKKPPGMWPRRASVASSDEGSPKRDDQALLAAQNIAHNAGGSGELSIPRIDIKATE